MSVALAVLFDRQPAYPSWVRGQDFVVVADVSFGQVVFDDGAASVPSGEVVAEVEERHDVGVVGALLAGAEQAGMVDAFASGPADSCSFPFVHYELATLRYPCDERREQESVPLQEMIAFCTSEFWERRKPELRIQWLEWHQNVR